MATENLPTKGQITALNDLVALTDIKDDVDKAIAHIEAQLEFSEGDDAWAKAATNALALHRYTERLLFQRISRLEREQVPANEAPKRPREANSALTNDVLRHGYDVDANTRRTVKAVDEAMAEVVSRVDAVKSDRDDEIAQSAGHRDEGFLAATGSVVRKLNGLRQALQNRRGELSKVEARKEHEQRNAGRQEAFIEAARIVLDKDTYLRIWETAERFGFPAPMRDAAGGGDG